MTDGGDPIQRIEPKEVPTRALHLGLLAAQLLVGAFLLAPTDVALADAGWVEPAMAPLWVTPDGHVVGAVFKPQRRPALMRTTGDGRVDPAFNGRLFETRMLVAVGQDGDKIVYVDAEGVQRTLRRALPSGLPDPTFGVGGAVTVSDAIRVVADGEHRVLVLLSHGVVVRFTADGEPDPGWSSAEPEASNGEFQIHDLAAMPDNGIVTVETDGSAVRLRRFRPDGRPDRSWGRGGAVDVHTPESRPAWFGQGLARSLAVFPDGSVTVAWTTGAVAADGDVARPLQTHLVRLSAEGSMFRQRVGLTSCSEERVSLDVGPAGTTLLTGSLRGRATEGTPFGSGFVAALGPDLAPVASFGGGGIVIVDEPKAFTVLTAVDDPTHRRILAGAASYSGVDRGAQPIPVTYRSVAIPTVSPAGPTHASSDPCSPAGTTPTTAAAARGRAARDASAPPSTGAPTTRAEGARDQAGTAHDIATRTIRSQDDDGDRPSPQWLGTVAAATAIVGAATLRWHRRRMPRHPPVVPPGE